MTGQAGAPAGAAMAIDDLLDSCAQIQPGQEVLILAHVDGLHGGDNLVDEQAIAWIQAGVQARGARPSVLWIDEPAVPHKWRFPPVVEAAMLGCDVVINHVFDLVTEEIAEFRAFIAEHEKWMVRNFATTAPLLCTAWARTPYELVSEIRFQASMAFKPGRPFVLTDPNGTHLEGMLAGAEARPGVPGAPYSSRRREAGHYLPWPEWVHPPVNVAGTSGVLVFDCMLSWWSRYIGISPYFDAPVRMTIDDNRITAIGGGREAEALRSFLADMRTRVGDGVYDLRAFHFGVHPQAIVAPHQCPNILHRRLIEHSHTCNLHLHIGAPPSTLDYPYWMHCTGDLRQPTLKVGEALVHDRGHLTALDNPLVKLIAQKYPGRPGLEPAPRSF